MLSVSPALTLYSQYTPFTEPARKHQSPPLWETGFNWLISCSHSGVRPGSSLSSPEPVRGLCPVLYFLVSLGLLSSTHLWGLLICSSFTAGCGDSACFPEPFLSPEGRARYPLPCPLPPYSSLKISPQALWILKDLLHITNI